MPIDCPELSQKARAIFEKLKPHFPPDPWGSPKWFEDGRVFRDLGERVFDLRKSADGEKITNDLFHTLGYMLTIAVGVFKDHHGKSANLEGFRLTPMLLNKLELYDLLTELEYQIEIAPIVDA